MTNISAVVPLELSDFAAAAERLHGQIENTPLQRLSETAPERSPWLKLETVQLGGSTKIRGALNAALAAPSDRLEAGLVTVSSGNMGRAVAWTARHLGIGATIGLPMNAPQVKVNAITDLGAAVVPLSPDQWWQAIVESEISGVDGYFIHPVLNKQVIAGVGTIAMELFDSDIDFSTLYVPFGGGALALACAYVASFRSPSTAVVACEPARKAPLFASFASGAETSVEPQASVADAAGAPRLLPGMWPYFGELLGGARAIPEDAIMDSIRLLASHADTVAEGAGALSLAGALADRTDGEVACVITGRNIEPSLHAEIIAGRV